MAQIGKKKGAYIGPRMTEFSKKDKSLYTKAKSGLTSRFKGLKQGVQKGVSRIVTKEEQNKIGMGIRKVGSGAKKVVTSKEAKSFGSALYGGLQRFGEGQRRMWEAKPMKKKVRKMY